MLKLLAAFVIAMALMVGGLSILYYFEDLISTYPTYAEAEQDSAIARGWIPAYIPRSAREIREVHNVDTNRQWLRFRLPEADARQMVRRMLPLSYADLRDARARPPRWDGPWLPELEQNSLAATRGRLSLHRDTTPGLGARCVAVDWSEPVTAYAWSC